MNCTDENNIEQANDGDRHVFGLMANNCKLLNGFHYYDETTGLKLNPNDHEERYLTRPELDEIEKLISAAINFQSKKDRDERLRRAKEIILQAMGENGGHG